MVHFVVPSPSINTVLQQALQRSCYGGRSRGRVFSSSPTGPSNLNLFTLQTIIEEAWVRMARTTIERLDFRTLIPKYDREQTLFFLDPPYWGIKGYIHNFVEQDFMDLAALLAALKGRFIMTINDTPEVREIFGGFSIEETHLKYSINNKFGGQIKDRTELLVSN